jgi:thiamine-phosphate pyrophosphorylase
VTLPRLLVLTDRHQLPAGRDLVDTVRACAAAGRCGVMVRELDLPREQRRDLVSRLAVIDDVLLVSAREWFPGCRGVHLSAVQPCPPDLTFHGRSCHDDEEVRRGVADGAAYVTISPVATSRSKPGYGPALGPAGVRRAVRLAGGVPVFALGGVDAQNAGACIDAGAHGVALMGAVMRADDPGAVVRTILEEVAP